MMLIHHKFYKYICSSFSLASMHFCYRIVFQLNPTAGQGNALTGGHQHWPLTSVTFASLYFRSGVIFFSCVFLAAEQ